MIHRHLGMHFCASRTRRTQSGNPKQHKSAISDYVYKTNGKSTYFNVGRPARVTQKGPRTPLRTGDTTQASTRSTPRHPGEATARSRHPHNTPPCLLAARSSAPEPSLDSPERPPGLPQGPRAPSGPPRDGKPFHGAAKCLHSAPGPGSPLYIRYMYVYMYVYTYIYISVAISVQEIINCRVCGWGIAYTHAMCDVRPRF